MSVVKAGRTRQTVLEDGRHRTSVKVSYGETTRTIWFITDADVPFVEHNRGDIWLPSLLILAMRRGERQAKRRLAPNRPDLGLLNSEFELC